MSELNVQKTLDDLFNSSAFKKSEAHKKLLMYLVQCYQNNVIPTEHDIAHHVYSRDDSFNPVEDTLVRVSIYKLRKKLENYYQGEGKNNAVKIMIPKGQYNIEFIEKQNSKSGKNSSIVFWGMTFIILILLVAFIFQLSQNNKMSKQLSGYHFMPRETHLWASFFDNDMPFNLVIGDYYIYEKYDPTLGYNQRVMDYFINSDQEFDTYLSNQPSGVFKKLPIGEIPHHTIFNVKDLSFIFTSFQKEFSIEMSSAFDLNNTIGQNILYVGDFKSTRLLNGLISSEGISFHNTSGFSGILNIHDSETDSTLVFDCSKQDLSKQSQSLDYCLLLRKKGPHGENYFFITGFGYTAQLETIHMLKDPQKLQELDSFLYKDNHTITEFMVVIRVSGVYMTPYDLDIVYFKELISK